MKLGLTGLVLFRSGRILAVSFDPTVVNTTSK
jgi:hypothetical protein